MRDSGKLAEAEKAWLAAVKELHQAQDEEKAARQSEQETKAVLDFLKNTLLVGGAAWGRVAQRRPSGPAARARTSRCIKRSTMAESKVDRGVRGSAAGRSNGPRSCWARAT